jgi:hypothetical protein
VSCALLAKISRHLDFGKASGKSKSAAFGGINVLLFGDFHQIPPLAGTPLYMPPDVSKKGQQSDNYVGHEIYRQFTTAVELDQQMRVKDSVWQGVLSRMRYANCADADFETIRSVTLRVSSGANTNADC